MWIGWVESNFRNQTLKSWANLDNPFKRTDYAKYCMSPSLDGTRDITREQLSIDFVHRFSFFSSSWISIVRLIKLNHKCMYIHLTTNILKYQSRGKICFHEKYFFCVYSSILLYCCDITDFRRVPPERTTYKKLMKNLKNHISWLDYPNLSKLLHSPFTQSA